MSNTRPLGFDAIAEARRQWESHGWAEPAAMAATTSIMRAHQIVLARTDDGWAAFEDRCTHRGGSLAGGQMTCGTVICPWHGSQFDVATGAVSAGPAEESIRTFPVEVEGGEVRLDPRR